MTWKCPDCGTTENTDDLTHCTCGHEHEVTKLVSTNAVAPEILKSEKHETEPDRFKYEGLISLLIVPIGYLSTVFILPNGSSLLLVSMSIFVISIIGFTFGVRSLMDKKTNIINAILGGIGVIICSFAALIATYVLLSA